MANDPQHPSYCRKEAEIAELQTQVETLNKIVMGNGQPGLSQTVPVLNRNVNELNKTIGDLTTGVSGLLKFQENQNGIHEGKERERRVAIDKRNRNRWVIGILVTAILAMAGWIIKLHVGL